MTQMDKLHKQQLKKEYITRMVELSRKTKDDSFSKEDRDEYVELSQRVFIIGQELWQNWLVEKKVKTGDKPIFL
jgi:hypothetical protein